MVFAAATSYSRDSILGDLSQGLGLLLGEDLPRPIVRRGCVVKTMLMICGPSGWVRYRVLCSIVLNIASIDSATAYDMPILKARMVRRPTDYGPALQGLISHDQAALIELQVSHFRFRVSLCPINGPRSRIFPARTVEIPEATYLKLNNQGKPSSDNPTSCRSHRGKRELAGDAGVPVALLAYAYLFPWGQALAA